MRLVDETWMQRALTLARRAEGLTRPNPPVGAVLVKNGRVVGEGYHRKAGGPHAEIVALRKAGAKARGATLYVTLEPCSTFGRTPPCTDAVLAAGIKRVVVSVLDPNPKHAGRGLQLLRARGVPVTQGVCAADGAALLAPFATWITTGLPLVTLKLGMSLDGRIAQADGTSRWITGPESRALVQDLRRRADAILVGFGTALKDNPSLLPAPSRGRRPLRVVLDRHGKLPLRHRVFTDGLPRQTLVVVGPRTPMRYRKRLEKAGIEILVVPVDQRGFRLEILLQELGKRGVIHLLCEGGGRLAGSLLQDKLVDEAWVFVAPRMLGEHGLPAVAGHLENLNEHPSLRMVSCRMVGGDVLIRATRRDS